MKITQSKAKNLLSHITIEVVLEDYEGRVNKVLEDYRKKATIPGFRKGKTPMSIINKKYRASVLVDEVNKLLQDEMYKHITTKNIRVLGSPMPLEENQIDWDKSTEFKFVYEIGLAPEFDLDINSKDKLDYYNIKADTKLIDTYCKDIAKRHGTMKHPEVSSEGDLLFCIINQLDNNYNIIDGGISHEATVSIDVITNNKIKKKFIGVKQGDMINVNVKKAFTNHTDLAAMLNISHQELHNLASEEFQFTVKTISSMQPAEMNIELFEKVYGKEKVSNLKEFKANIKKEAEAQFVVESDRMLKNDVVTYLINKLKLKLPDEFLKRWLVKTSEQPITMEMLDNEYQMYSKSLQWQLIESKILKENNIKVTQDDVLQHTKILVSRQMQQYGQSNSNDKQLTDIANNILKNEKENKKIYDQILDSRTLKIYKEKFKLIEKNISYDDFVKLASEK